ncbi:PIN domain-containing protein [Thauera aromatica]|uniref:PIN domain-containing protein n=1 Tax=Thauera aromatica TaxID=59405 RepID=UPI001FFD955E|nr:PIN domain-containing protein [Thauera aromatica]MCK2095927.1 PIN domain-containing protein [Thauera aromatica]
MQTPSSAPAPGTIRLVLDTNTVLALWMFRDPRLRALRSAIEEGRYRLFGREDASEELRRVLAYRQFGLEPDEQAALWHGYLARLEPADFAPAAEALAALPNCRDADDQKFLEIALRHAATHLLTRDRALLALARHRAIRPHFSILTPERFIDAACPPPGPGVAGKPE